MNEFGALLRTARDRVRPRDLGLPAGGTRKVPGLRREELAAFAGLSVDYVMRLEQGRADNPSRQVVAALGRALQLSRAELDHFYRIAGHLPPTDLMVPTHIGPGVLRLLTRLSDTPVAVYDAAWTLLSHNVVWGAVLGPTPVGRAANVAWAAFTNDPSTVSAGGPEALTALRRAFVSDLRRTSARYPHDPFLRQLIADLRETEPVFARLWAEGGDASTYVAEGKTVTHPAVGTLTLDCDVLTSVDHDLRILAYTAEPGSDSERKLRSLAGQLSGLSSP
ncbi:transcriptional regulator [Virgisporangium aliadipatigenens]|uniref:Transcriptional regulator n=1 Tax=Virgisporangium aliadipatigenens TaxID=741659 RepID=A0A8J3YGE1_9ACTN|nr:helix-turn-helix transcriptional regulator [Virgisporangium aliadipatigenens]GIJ44566.1 transcriptional regulator [Virgisporangium aliadipatigenens]